MPPGPFLPVGFTVCQVEDRKTGPGRRENPKDTLFFSWDPILGENLRGYSETMDERGFLVSHIHANLFFLLTMTLSLAGLVFSHVEPVSIPCSYGITKAREEQEQEKNSVYMYDTYNYYI